VVLFHAVYVPGCAVLFCAVLCAVQALLAGGTFNGELIMWDLRNEDANAQVQTKNGVDSTGQR
jgi:hypothetical protein